MVVRIPIHLLHIQAFCEYQLFLEYVKGIHVAPTMDMQKGRQIHALLEDRHREDTMFPLYVSDALKQSREEDRVLVGREIPVSGILLYGRFDEVHLAPSRVLIIDDKPNNYPFLSNKKQVWGYCLAFREQYQATRPVFAALRQRNTQEIFWQKEFTVDDQNMVIESAIRILDILNGMREPEPTSRSTKCSSCRLRVECDQCLTN